MTLLDYGPPGRYDIFEWARRTYGGAPTKIRLDVALALPSSAADVLARHTALLEQEAREREARKGKHLTTMLEHLAGSIK